MTEEKEPERSIFRDSVEKMCCLRKVGASSVERSKLKPKAVLPMTSIASFRERREKLISCSCERWRVADSTRDWMEGTRLATWEG